MKSSVTSGIVAVLLAALVIGCGGSDAAPSSSLLPSTGSGKGTTTGTTGEPGTVTVAEIAAIDLKFSDVSDTNAKPTRITRVSDLSGVGYTPKGAYLYLVQDVPGGGTREFSLDVPLEFVQGATYTYAPSTDETPIVVDYDEEDGSDETGGQTWHAASGGTVTVTAVTKDSVTLRFEDLRFSSGGEEGNAATGSFTVSGTLRIQYVEAPEGEVVATSSLVRRNHPPQ